MAFIAGDTVMFVNSSPVLFSPRSPFIGRVEDLTVANLAVDWESGIRTVYADSGAQLYLVGTPAAPSLIGSVVHVGSTFPNPAGRTQGVVVSHVSLSLASTGPVADIVVVKVPNGFMTLPAASVVVVPSA